MHAAPSRHATCIRLFICIRKRTLDASTESRIPSLTKKWGCNSMRLNSVARKRYMQRHSPAYVQCSETDCLRILISDQPERRPIAFGMPRPAAKAKQSSTARQRTGLRCMEPRCNAPIRPCVAAQTAWLNGDKVRRHQHGMLQGVAAGGANSCAISRGQELPRPRLQTLSTPCGRYCSD
jgi:hypothetical protein